MHFSTTTHKITYIILLFKNGLTTLSGQAIFLVAFSFMMSNITLKYVKHDVMCSKEECRMQRYIIIYIHRAPVNLDNFLCIFPFTAVF